MTLLTAESYARLADNGHPTELVRGRLVTMNLPAPRHGYVCARISRLLGNQVEQFDLGRVVTNDSGVVTERDPDTVRGADVAFYSYGRLPKGPLPDGYLSISPDLALEVLSPTDAWKTVMTRVGEYLNASVSVVCVLDPRPETAHLFYPDRPAQALGAKEELQFGDLLPGFRILIGKIFE